MIITLDIAAKLHIDMSDFGLLPYAADADARRAAASNTRFEFLKRLSLFLFL